MKEHKIITYLSFKGNCEEAINAYIQAFGGKILYLSRWDENNCETKSQIGQVMHAEFLLGETNLSAGDVAEGDLPNGAIKLMIHMETEAEARQSVAVLARDGQVLSPLQPHPAPDDGGMGCVLKDKYGVTWILTCPNPAKQANP